jgi:hypothetical protein
MLKKLTAKVQKISPNLPPSAGLFSHPLVIGPEDTDLVTRRGILYVVFDISSGEQFDTALVIKVIHDVLYESYYQSDNISPIQSLEKAISEVKDKVIKLTNETITTISSPAEFNIIAGVLWGNVMYVVSFGETASFLMRDDGEIRPLSTNTEGSFSATSGVVKDEDVMIFATKKFAEQISPQKLLSSFVSTDELSLASSCLIMKFVVDTHFTEDEVVEFAPHKEVPKFNITDKLKNLLARLKRPTTGQGKGIKLKKFRSKKNVLTVVMLVAALTLFASIAFSIKNRKSDTVTPAAKSVTDANEVLSDQSEQAENSTLSAQPDTSKDEEYKIKRINPEAFYDIKIVDESASPSQIFIKNDKVQVYDKSSAKIYSSDLKTPKFVATDEKLESEGIFGLYLGNIYTLSGDTITKRTSDGTETTWTQNSLLTGANSIAIDMSIYILKGDGSLLRFTRGEQDSFNVTGMDKGFSSPSQVLTNYDFDNIYIVDSGNNRIVVLSKEGVLQKQYLSSNQELWKELRGIAVSEDETTAYILDGSRVYTFSLE